MAGKTTQKLRL